MIAIIATLVIISIIGANSEIEVGVRVPFIQIIPVEAGSTYGGKIYSSRSCGGPGKVIDFRTSNCTEESVCQYPARPQYSETDFIPSEDILQVGIRLLITYQGEKKLALEKAVENSQLTAGHRYRVEMHGGPKEEYKGKRFTLDYNIYRIADSSVEACVQADFDIV